MSAYDVHVRVAPEIADRLLNSWSEPMQIRGERQDDGSYVMQCRAAWTPERLELDDDDYVIFKIDVAKVSGDELRTFIGCVRDAFPDHKVVVLAPGISIERLPREKLEELLRWE